MTTAEPWTLKNECDCGHEKDSHHAGKHNCLALFCQCQAFGKSVDERKSVLRPVDQPPAKKSRVKPHASTSCECAACKEWVSSRVRVERFIL